MNLWFVSIRQKYRIVEVKGPSDKLSSKQMLWLDYLLANGVTAEVCYVEGESVVLLHVIDLIMVFGFPQS